MPSGKNGAVYELSLSTAESGPGQNEILTEILGGLGIVQNSIVECSQWPGTSFAVYFKTAEEARRLRNHLRGFKLKHVRITVKHLVKKDWQTKWTKVLKPFRLTRSFAVIPAGSRRKTRRFKTLLPIFIDPGMAFGTGLHATTRFMAGFIERCRGRFHDCLDIGTGTGILAMLAEKCGGQDILAIDISQEAVRAARLNINKNKCTSITLKTGDAGNIQLKRQFDLVCANLITRDLIDLGRRLVSFVKPGRYLAVSGISVNNYEVFRAAYRRYPLRCLKIEKDEGWVAILYKKTSRTRTIQ